MIYRQNFNKPHQYSFRYFILFIIFTTISTFPQDNGEKIFLSVCRACHTIGQGRLVGPDLANIQNRLEEGWIIKFVKSSQKMIKSGDPLAVKTFNEYNKIIMPDQALTDAQIISVINYIKEKSPTETTSKEVKTPAFTLKNSLGFNLDEAGRDEYKLGWHYFTGEKRFENSGPPCLSCHNVVKDNLISGGLLSKDLTNAFSRLNAAGINAIISNPPFPIMRIAFENKQLTKDERYYLLAFLKQADYDSIYQHPVNYDKRFIYSGIIGLIFLLGFFGLVWYGRKKVSVKQDIFKRQLKSK